MSSSNSFTPCFQKLEVNITQHCPRKIHWFAKQCGQNPYPIPLWLLKLQSSKDGISQQNCRLMTVLVGNRTLSVISQIIVSGFITGLPNNLFYYSSLFLVQFVSLIYLNYEVSWVASFRKSSVSTKAARTGLLMVLRCHCIINTPSHGKSHNPEKVANFFKLLLTKE